MCVLVTSDVFQCDLILLEARQLVTDLPMATAKFDLGSPRVKNVGMAFALTLHDECLVRLSIRPFLLGCSVDSFKFSQFELLFLARWVSDDHGTVFREVPSQHQNARLALPMLIVKARVS